LPREGTLNPVALWMNFDWLLFLQATRLAEVCWTKSQTQGADVCVHPLSPGRKGVIAPENLHPQYSSVNLIPGFFFFFFQTA